MTKEKRYEKVVKVDYGDFLIISYFLNLVFLPVACAMALFTQGNVRFYSLILIVIVFLINISGWILEVKKEVYYKERK